MSKVTVWIIIGVTLILIGSLIFVAVMTINHWDFTKLETMQYQTNTHPINESFENINIQTNTADIKLLLSNDNTCQVVCVEQEHLRHSVAVKDGTLTITQSQDDRKWYHHIGISVKTTKITVYLPRELYTSLTVHSTTGDTEIPSDFQFQTIDISCTTGDIECNASASVSMKLKCSTGDIEAKGISVGELDTSVNTGDIELSDIECHGDIRVGFTTGDAELSDISCKNLSAKGNTGDFVMEDMIVSEKITAGTNTGDIRFQGCDAAEIFMKTNTGDIRGSFLSDKVFTTRTNTGSVKVPSSQNGGKCEMITGTGDIRVTVANR